MIAARMGLAIGVLAGCVLVSVAHARQEDSPDEEPVDARAEMRQERLRRLREEKAEHLRPPEPPGPFQRFLGRVQERVTGDGTGPHLAGFRPTLGGLKPGAGVAGGIVFEPLASSDPVFVRAELLGSLERYWGTGVRGGLRLDPARVLGYVRYRHMPKEDVYGIGGDSRQEDRSNYRLNELVIGALGGIGITDLVSAGLRTSYVHSDPGPGRDDDYPTTQEWVAPLSFESLETSAQHVAFGAWLEIDGRNPGAAHRDFSYLTHTEPDVIGMPLATDRGIYALIDLVHYASVDGSPFGFTRVTLQSQQYLRFRHGRNVFAFREYAAFSDADGGDVPIYMLPALGGAYTLRGYDLFRFRDRHALMLNAEYRWQVWLFADLALFTDVGQVYSRIEDVTLSDLHTSYGIGVRLRATDRGLARADIARSVEGIQLHLRLTSRF